MIDAKVIEDSITMSNNRLTTLQISLPKVLLAEFQTHRMFSRNFSSSRAIPTKTLNAKESFEPAYWGLNQAGMKAKLEELPEADKAAAKKIWHDTIAYCKESAQKLAELGLHKQWSNRLNDWHAFAYGIVSATDFDNFFGLRIHEDAQPEMRILAEKMQAAIKSSVPTERGIGEWHLPYVTKNERQTFLLSDCAKLSAARCCRVSYLKHDGTSPSYDDDIKLYNRLAEANPPHMSPLEHQATPSNDSTFETNFTGWIQHRKFVELS